MNVIDLCAQIGIASAVTLKLGQSQVIAALALLFTVMKEPKLGLDLSGGTQLIYDVDIEDIELPGDRIAWRITRKNVERLPVERLLRR